jgi:hypothetical protein
MPIAPACPEGTCNYPQYSSLAICFKTSNITSLLNISSMPSNITDDLGHIISANITLPNGAYLEAGDRIMNITTLYSTPGSLMNGSLAFKNEKDIDEIALNSHFIIWQNNNGTNQPPYGAIEVLFYWCINSYTSSVTGSDSSTNITTIPATPSTESGNLILQTSNSTTGNEKFTITAAANAALAAYIGRACTGFYAPGLSGGYSSDAAEALERSIYQTPIQEQVNGKEADETQFRAVELMMRNIGTSLTNRYVFFSLFHHHS